MTRYRLFAFDLDGTLLAPDGALPDDVRQFVLEISRSARVTIATGRSLASARPYMEELKVRTPVVIYHGAVVYDPVQARPLRELHIPGREARRAFAAAQRFPVHPQIYRAVDDPTVYTPRITPPIEAFVSNENLRAEEVPNPDALLSTGPLKLLFIGEADIIPDLIATLRESVPEVTTVRAARNYVEVLPPGISKGDGLAWLCDHLGIPLSLTVAVGDQESDLDMIERAGLGVAMMEGDPAIRSHAQVVVKSVIELRDLLDLR